jgi:sugar phosphate isomerase/epimerase
MRAAARTREHVPLCLGVSTLFASHAEPLTPELLDRMRQWGLAAIEIADYHANFDYGDAGWLDRARGWLGDRGLLLNSVHAHFERRCPGSDLAAPDRARRQDSVAIYRGGLEALARLGGDILVTHHLAIPAPDREPEAHAQRRGAFAASLRELAPMAADLGVRLAIENGGSGWPADVRHLTALISEAETHEVVGVCLDTGHRHRNGDVASAIREAGSTLSTLHVHDNHGQRDEHILPLQGTIAWPSVVQALREIGYPGVFMYEIGAAADPSELPANYRALMTLP